MSAKTHGTLKCAIATACKCADCRWARKQDKREQAARKRTFSAVSYMAHQYLTKEAAPPTLPSCYLSPDRDPRIAPLPGDVFAKDGITRQVKNVALHTPQKMVDCHDVKADGIIVSRSFPMPTWRKWSKTATILNPVEPANV